MHHALIAKIRDEEPLSLKDALGHDQWVDDMKSELGSIYKNTWELCELTRSEPEFFSGEEKVAYTHPYTYLGVTFRGPKFSL